jgi:hypothetical protein
MESKKQVTTLFQIEANFHDADGDFETRYMLALKMNLDL